MAKYQYQDEIPSGLLTADFILRNQEPIAQRLAEWLPVDCRVLEIASGWGQHACYWSWRLPELGITNCYWQPSECRQRLDDLHDWYQYADHNRVSAPICLDLDDLGDQHSVISNWDALVAVNLSHYVNTDTLSVLFRLASQVLPSAGKLLLYGPVNRFGEFTSQGNYELDQWLKQRQPSSGIKDILQLTHLAESVGLYLHADQTMPANNTWLVFVKT